MGATSFGLLNYVVLFAYLGFVVILGIAVSKRQATAEDYFLAGRRMPWIVVSMSLFVSTVSAVSYMGVVGLAYRENVTFLAGYFMLPAVAVAIICLFLPFYQRLGVTTSYEYVERRFGREAYYVTAVLFILGRIGWLGVVIYAPALALSVVTGMDVTVAIFLIGGAGTLYTVAGGLTAVIWTDVAQFLVLIGGALWVAASLILAVPGGVSEILRVAEAAGHTRLFTASLSLTEMTTAGVAIALFFTFLYDYGADQLMVQRLLATGSLRSMARATMLNAAMLLAVLSLLAFIGLGLLAYEHAGAGEFPATLSPDQVLPYYIVHGLPAGISGLVISGVFAAAMSSLDSGINSLATVLMNDVLRPLRRPERAARSVVSQARLWTVLFGVLATVVGLLAQQIEELLKASQTFLGIATGPILALFLLGILTRRGSFAAWLVGVVGSVGLMLWVLKATEVHFVYFFAISFAACFVIACLASFVLPPGKGDASLCVWG